MSRTTLGALFVVAIFARQAEASAFLGQRPPKPAMAPLLDELEKIVGQDQRNSTEGRVTSIEEALRLTFQAMPKTGDGGVKSDAVRYMVHRYFVDRHGWFVDGLGSGADTSNSSSPATIFQDQGDDDVQELFDSRFQNHSFSLHQVAVFAATFEGFVHTETLERLNAAYRASGISNATQRMTDKEMTDVLENYMVMYVLGFNYSVVTPRKIRNMRRKIHELYPTWEVTKKWVGEVFQEVRDAHDASAALPNSFDFSVKVLETISDRYGRWQNSECVDLKTSLLKMETPGTGRVSLKAFYESAMQGNWQFSETIEYMRQSGSVDESDPARPSVIIPNYVNAASNCMASSKFYSVCCIDECETLVSSLETSTASPEASPKRIIDLVTNLPSPTTAAPRTLPASLIQRLEQIASHHHGTVPFHGRLFAQWMHHAYPRECSYPHMSGTLNPLSPREWVQKTGQKAETDNKTMQFHIDQGNQMLREQQETGELPWTAEEEFFVAPQRVATQGSRNSLWAIGKGFLGSGAIAFVVTAFRAFPTAKPENLLRPTERYCV